MQSKDKAVLKRILSVPFTLAQAVTKRPFSAHTKINPHQSVSHAVGLMDVIVSLRLKKT